MSATLYSSVSYTLAGLMEKIKLGEIGLPDIQRPFVWRNTKVRDLFDSLYRGYPVGYLLFWHSAGETGYSQIGAESKQVPPSLLIVDGQQRLTSLYAVFEGVPVMMPRDYSSERIMIAFHPMDEKFAVADAAIRKNPEYIPDISALWAEKTDLFELTDDYMARLRLARDVTAEDGRAIRQAINRLYNLTNSPLIALQLASNVSEEQVAEVFVRINGQGTPLNQADFILTLLSVFWDEGRHELEQFCRKGQQPMASGPSPYNPFIKPAPDELLRVDVALAFRRARLEHVYSILRGKDMVTGRFSVERREEQFALLKQAQDDVLNLTHWHEFLKCLMKAGYRRENMISSKNALLYAYAFYLIGKRDFLVNHSDLRDVIARWFFMTSLTSRYANSPETEMAKDLNRLSDVHDAAGFAALLEGIIADALMEDYWNITLPNDLATSSASSPSLNAYHAALVLLDAKVLFSDLKVADLLNPTTHAPKAALERHHLFARAYLKSQGITETRDINQIANYALVEWADNIDISDAPPSQYFPPYRAKYTPVQMESMCHWHALPDAWEQMDYRDFLAQRRKQIAAIIRKGFERL